MYRVTSLALVSLMTCLLAVSIQASDIEDDSMKEKMYEEKGQHSPPSYMGKVVAVTDKMVTIKPQGNLTFTYKKQLKDGSFKSWEHVQDNTKPHRSFVFTDSLHWHNGTLPNGRLGPLMFRTPSDDEHKISDLQTGDIVWIDCHYLRETDFCGSIRILRRPGGSVPLTIGDDKLPVEKRTSTLLNAKQQREEKAIAIIQVLARNLRTLSR